MRSRTASRSGSMAAPRAVTAKLAENGCRWRRGESLAVFVCEIRRARWVSTCVNEGGDPKVDTLSSDLTGEVAMLERSGEFWEAIPGLVEARVTSVFGRAPKAREPVIEYLRDLEVVARQECSRRQAVQVIASGRRLLGDETDIGNGLGHSFEKALMG
jgi:hypothetical protein